MSLKKHSWFVRYASALAAVGAALLLRLALTHWIGPGLPTYITFYPAVMLTALAAGIGPGILATVAAALVTDYWIIPPQGLLQYEHLIDAIGLAFFTGMGVLMSVVAGLYRHLRTNLEKLIADRTRELSDTHAALKQQVELIDPARAEVIVSEMQRVLHDRRVAPAVPAEAAPAVGWALHLPTLAGVIVAAVGLLALIGWTFGVEPLKSILPGLATMKPNTALCLALAGAALALRERRAWRVAAVALVGAVGALTLFEYISGADLHIDQLLFQDLGNDETVHLGRMVPATALGLVCTAVALLLLNARSTAAGLACQALAIAAGMIGTTAALGYAYGAPKLFHFTGSAGMAFHTGVALAVLGAGVLCARKDGLMTSLVKHTPGGQLMRHLLWAAVLVPFVIGWLHVKGEFLGLVSSPVAAALFVLAMMVSLAGLIWITARQLDRTDASRRETELLLRNQAELMDQSQDALIVRDTGGSIRFWNRGATALYGWSAAEALGQRIHVLLRTEGLPAEYDAQLERAGHWEGELTQTSRDGRHITVESRKTAIRTADGRAMIMESSRDITASKRAEEAVRISEQRYRSVMTLAPDALFLTDEEGRFLDVNDRACESLGYSRDQLLQMRITDVEEGFDVEGVKRILAQLPEGGAVTLEGRHCRSDGLRFSVEIRLTAIEISGRRFFLAFIRDITVRKQIEESLRKATAELERRAAELQQTNETLRISRLAALNLMDDSIAARQQAEEATATLRASDAALHKVNRTLMALGKSGKAMLRATDETAFMQEVCQIVVEDCGHPMVWLGFAENDEARSIRPVAYSGFEKGYLETLKLTWADTDRGRGPTGKSIRTGEPCECRNMLTDPAFLPWREEAIKRGYASSIALPLMSEDKVFGALTIYFKEPDSCSQDEAELLTELAGDLAHGVSAIRLRQARARAEAELQRTADRLRLLSNVSAQLLAAPDPQTIITDLCRQTMEHLDCHVFFNFLAEEVIGAGGASKKKSLAAGAASEEGVIGAEGAAKQDGHWPLRGVIGEEVIGAKGTSEEKSLGAGAPSTEEVIGARVPSLTRTLSVNDAAQRPMTHDQSSMTRALPANDCASPHDAAQPLMTRALPANDGASPNDAALPPPARLHLNAYAGIPEAEARRIEWLDYGVAVCGCAARDGCRIVAEHIPTTPDPRTELVRSYGVKAYACHPLLDESGGVIGTLSFGTRSHETFSAEDLALMKAVANQVAIAMNRIRSEQAVMQAKEEWERTFDSVPDLIAILDRKHQIIRVNRAMAARLNRAPKDCLGLKCYEAVHGASKPPALCPHLLTLADSREHNAEVHEDHLGGDFLVSTTPMRDPQGELIGAVHVARDISDRIRAEKALKDSEKRYRTLFSSMSEGFGLLEIVRDPDGNARDGRFLNVNPAFERLTGLQSREIVGKTALAVLPESEAGWIEHFTRVVQTGLPERFESVNEASGRHLDVSAFSPEPGQVALVIGDVTEVREMQKREREDAVRLAWGQSAADTINAMREGVVLLEPDGTIISVNPAIEQLTGMSSGAVIGRNIRTFLAMFLAGPDLKMAIRSLTELRRGRIPELAPVVLKGRGRLVHVFPSVTTMIAPDSDQHMIVMTIKDITELREAEERLGLAVDAGEAGIYEHAVPFEGAGYFSPRCAQLLGCDEASLSAPSGLAPWMAERAHPDDLAALRQTYRDFIEGRAEGYHAEMRLRHGRSRWVYVENFTKAAERDDRGHVVRVVGIMWDISARKRLEAEAQRYQKRLRSLAERLATSEEQDRWRISRYVHDTIIQNLSLASIHMGSVTGPLAKARMDEECEKLRKTRGLIDQAAEECRMVMTDLTPSLLYELGLVPALQDLAGRLKEQHGIHIGVEDAGLTTPMNNALRGLMFQSVRELIMNALKHAGKCEISVRVTQRGSLFVAQVRDSGAGFDPGALKDRDPKRGGFGLFNVRERIEGLGGRIVLRSSPGKGTRATIVVPMKERGE